MLVLALFFLLTPQPSHANTPEDVAMGQILLWECTRALDPQLEFVPAQFVPAIDELGALLPTTRGELMDSPLSQLKMHDLFDHLELRVRMLKYYLEKLAGLPQMPKTFRAALMQIHGSIFGQKPDALKDWQAQYYDHFLQHSERYLFTSSLHDWTRSPHEQDVLLNTDFTTQVLRWISQSRGALAELQVAFRLPRVVGIRKIIKEYFLKKGRFELSSFLRGYLRRMPNLEADVIYIDGDGVTHLVEVKGLSRLLTMNYLKRTHVLTKFYRLVLLRRLLVRYGIPIKIDLYCVRSKIDNNIAEYLSEYEIGYYRIDAK